MLLTRLGGSAFGDEQAWIDAATEHVLTRVAGQDFDILLVSR